MDNGEDVMVTELLKTNKIDREFFAQYISYARKNFRPQIHDSIT